jgi:hypothetical protein
MVIDPSLFTTPVSKATWTGVQGDPNASLTDSDGSLFISGATSQTRTTPRRAECSRRTDSSSRPARSSKAPAVRVLRVIGRRSWLG